MKKSSILKPLIFAICCFASLPIKSEEQSCRVNSEYNFNQKQIHHSLILDNEESIYYKPEIFFINIK
jgi:hypothetical protein